jgi:hypothetical protein
MPNGKKGGNNISDPVGTCPLKATIHVHVDGISTDTPKWTYTNVAGVTAKLSDGKSTPGPKKTSSKGDADFTGLTPDTYTVTIALEGSLSKYYDVDPPPPPQSATVAAKGEEYVYFKLKSFWIGARVLYPNGKPAKDYAYKLNLKNLKSGKLDDKWSLHTDGKSTEKDYIEKFVPKGRYQLSLPEVTDVAWPSPALTLDEAVDLAATVSGVDAGSAGTIDIYDIRDLSSPVETVQAKVEDGGAGKQLKASWTPKKDSLTKLKGATVVYSATAGGVSTFSGPAQLSSKQDFGVVDSTGAKLSGQLTVIYSGGASITAQVADGKASVNVPWAQTVARITFTGASPCGVTYEEEGAAARGFSLTA